MSRFLLMPIIIATVLGWVSTTHAQLLGFEDCWFALQPPSNVGLGQILARADRLETAALKYENFPYEQCFRLGRSCSRQSLDVDEESFDKAHGVCRFKYPALNVVDFETWRAQRGAYNSCMAEVMRREVAEIRAGVFADSEKAPEIGEVLGGEAGALNANEVRAISNDVTWCPTEKSGFRVAIVCQGRNLVVGTYQGESRMTHRVSQDGELCLFDFTSAETCHRVIREDGTLTLDPPHNVLDHPFTIISGVEGRGQWKQTCKVE